MRKQGVTSIYSALDEKRLSRLHGKRNQPRDTAQAMSQENVEAFKRGLRRQPRRRRNAARGTRSRGGWHSALHALLGGEQTVFRGHDGVREMLRDLNEAFGEIQMEIWRSGIWETGWSRWPATATWQGRKRRRDRDALGPRDRGQEWQDDFDSGLPRSQAGSRSRWALGVAREVPLRTRSA